MRPRAIAGGGAGGAGSAAPKARMVGSKEIRPLARFRRPIDNRALGSPCFAQKRWPSGHIVVPLDQRGRRPEAADCRGIKGPNGAANRRIMSVYEQRQAGIVGLIGATCEMDLAHR